MVAVAEPLPPPQHSPILGHLASSQTVCRPNPRRSFLIPLYDAPVGIGCFKKEGSRGLHQRDPVSETLLLSIAESHARWQRFTGHKVVEG